MHLENVCGRSLLVCLAFYVRRMNYKVTTKLSSLLLYRGHLLVKVEVKMCFFLFSRCLWSEYLEKSDTIFPQLLTMLTHFGLACEMPSVGNDIGSPDGTAPPVCYLVPWYFRPYRPRSLSNNWPSRPDSSQVGPWRPRQDWNVRYSAVTEV